jgi:hypothetical protein
MSSKKQTAVEWLEEQLKKGVDFNPLEPLSYLKAIDNVFEQAKAMERNQIMIAHYAGESPRIIHNNSIHYYSETYGS